MLAARSVLALALAVTIAGLNEAVAQSVTGWSNGTFPVAFTQTIGTSYGNLAFVGGGQANNGYGYPDVYSYDAGTNQITTHTNALTTARANTGAATAGDKILFVGGKESNDALSRGASVYDVSDGVWSYGANDLVAAREYIVGCGIGDSAVFVGGKHPGTELWVDVYSATTSTFTDAFAAASYLTVRDYVYGGPIGNSTTRCIFPGGSDGSGHSTRTDVFDFATGVYTNISARLNVARSWYAHASYGVDSYLVAGGEGESGNLNSIEIYSESTGVWTLVTPVVNGDLFAPSAGLSGDGRLVFIAGGYDSVTGDQTDAVYAYDTVTRALTPTRPLTSRRAAMGQSVRAGKKLLFIGGNSVGLTLFVYDAYDPAQCGPCVHGGFCRPLVSSFLCTCRAQWIGVNCGSLLTSSTALPAPPSSSAAAAGGASTAVAAASTGGGGGGGTSVATGVSGSMPCAAPAAIVHAAAVVVVASVLALRSV